MPYTYLIMRSLFVFLLFASPAVAASVSVNSTGNPAVFSVVGTGMDAVAGIQLDIAYDTESLATPTVTQGVLIAGAMFAANTSLPGLIKIAIISSRPFSSSGQIATVSFASNTGSGSVPKITTILIDSKGSAIASTTGNPLVETAAPGTVLTPGVQPIQTPLTTLTNPLGATTTPTYLGTVTLPADQQQRVDEQPAPTLPPYTVEPQPEAEIVSEPAQHNVAPAADTKDTKAEETLQYVVYKGISDRFRQFNGDKSLPVMVTLFEKKVAQSIHQEPAILLSDGQSRATLTVDIPARIVSSPNFAVNGGTLISFKQHKQSKNRWTVEVQPESGSIRVSVTIITGAEEFEYPLTVAPPAKTGLTLDESGWNRFLKEVGSATAPLHDLNNDGVRDYLDEFVFIANHLAGKSNPTNPALPSK